MTVVGSPTLPRGKNGTVYDRVFWLSYAANTVLVTAVGLQFRFAELVKFLGGSEQLTGTIVSTGLVATIVVRLFLGREIDRHGIRIVWVGASLLGLCGCALFLFAHSLSWVLFAARICFAVGVAGMFTSSVVHIQNQVPGYRRTEIVGNLGTSGFLGMIAGSNLGDLVFSGMDAGMAQFYALFGGAMVLVMVYLVLVLILTRADVHQRPHETPAIHKLIFRYWPGNVVLVAMIMGMSITVTTVYLTRFSTHRGLSGIGTFFTAYALTAFVSRLWAQGWSRTIGRHHMILLGLCGHGIGQAMLAWVTREWQFVPPAMAAGFGHAMLFPAVVSLGAGAFPRHYRGTGTTIVLGFVDLGTAVFAPILGAIIDRAGFVPMFYYSGSMCFLVAVVYALTSARTPDDEMSSDQETELGLAAPPAAECSSDGELAATPTTACAHKE